MNKFSGVIEEVEQALSIKYNNIVYELKQQGIDVTTLSLGEAFFDIPIYPIDNFPQEKIYHYTHSRGIIELRKKVSDYYKSKFRVEVNPEKEILMTTGAKSAIHFSLMSILNPGDEVIVQEPLWVSYPSLIKFCYAKPVMMPYYEKVHDYEKYITANTKAIIVNNPHNPTGYIFSKSELQYLVDLAKANDIYLISDEAYSDFTLDDDFISIGELDKTKENVIVCNSISKNFGISGWRIGYVITNEQLTERILKINQHLITCPPSLLQYYVAEYFDNIVEITLPQIQEVVKKRNLISEFTKSIGLEQLPGSSTFYLFISLGTTKLTSDEFCTRLLQDEYICVVPGSGYGTSTEKFIRVAVGTESVEKIKSALTKIKLFIDRTS